MIEWCICVWNISTINTKLGLGIMDLLTNLTSAVLLVNTNHLYITNVSTMQKTLEINKQKN